jgi:7,8-dihydropterin-6-yl-methyl-4-(beta-D-ribofuranosyl)aminobenzene 5'-phosphate synthase
MKIFFIKHIICLLAAVLVINVARAQTRNVSKLKVTILSTMLAEAGIGEWGFAALVECDGHKILFDTGARPETVLSNAAELNIDLSDVVDVFISHSHNDHTGGLITLRKALMKKNSAALSVVHIGEGAFYGRPGNDEYTAFVQNMKKEFEETGGKFFVYSNAKEFLPGLYITGPVPRKHAEKNWSGKGKVKLPNGDIVEDNVPEDQSLVFNTNDGLVIISGCGHSGIINTIDYAKTIFPTRNINTLIGGFHLFNLSDEKLKWTSDKLKEFGIQNLIGAHCTGINPVFIIRENLGLSRSHAVVGAVGAGYELGKGILPGQLAK